MVDKLEKWQIHQKIGYYLFKLVNILIIYDYFAMNILVENSLNVRIFFYEIVENCKAHCIKFHGALNIVNFMYMYLDMYCNKDCII